MRGMLMGVAIAAFAGSACASGGSYEMSEKASARLAEFDQTGDYQTCLGLRQINQIKALDEHNFLVRVGLNQYYLNRVSGRCTGASSTFNRLQYTTSISQLCRNEIVSVIDNTTGFVSGSCSLGDFERLEKKPDDAEDAGAETDES